MVNNTLFTNSGQYALGGLINGSADGIICTRDNNSEVFDILFENGVRLSLTKRYCLGKYNPTTFALDKLYVDALEVGDLILDSTGKKVKILNVSKRSGTGVLVQKQNFTLNMFPVWQDCSSMVAGPRTKCVHLSDDTVEEEIKICCGRVVKRELPVCKLLDKGIQINKCLECGQYKAEETDANA